MNTIAACAIGFALVLGTAAITGCEGTPDNAEGQGDTDNALKGGSGQHYAGKLQHVICDLKEPLAGDRTPAKPTTCDGDKIVTSDSQCLEPITDANYQTVLNGLATNLRCDAIRVYIDSDVAKASEYPALYNQVVHYARTNLGLLVYANPLATGSFGKSDNDFATWIADYANYFKPDFLAPFNESGLAVADQVAITEAVRGQLRYTPTALVGPDDQKVDESLDAVANVDAGAALVAAFDVVGSHNANSDDVATSGKWRSLQTAAGKDVWATENPRAWSELNDSNQEIGVKAVVDAPVSAVVLYLAFPKLVGPGGILTSKGTAIATGISNTP